MGEDVEYDPQDLEKLISEALEEVGDSKPRDMFAFGESELLQKLHSILPEYVQHYTDTTVILSELRSQLYDGTQGHLDRSSSLRQLHTVLTHCRKCPLMIPEPSLPNWNRLDPDVAFVTESPLYGGDGDQLFIDTMKDVGFKSSHVIATSVVRCEPKNRRTLESDEVSNCSTRFLFNELQLLQPKLIVPLGSLAASVLLGDPIKITQDRGSVFWVGAWPILPSFSPGYALRAKRTTDEFASDIRQAYEFVYGKG